ncbi:MAG: hypothetical protein WAM60_23480 [Candidatus Promineifilaceae bacterium]
MTPQTKITTAFLELIVQELETSYIEDDVHLTELTIFLVDLTPFRLRLSAETPFLIVSKENIQKLKRDQITEIVRQELYIRQERPGSAVILVEGDAEFLRPFGEDPFWAFIFDRRQMQSLLDHANPKRGLLESLREQIPLRFLSPYEPDQPVAGSQFHGRTTEINLILSYPDRSFSLEGGRRIGKTSLLKETQQQLKKRLPKEQHPRLVWYDFWGYSGIEPFIADVMRHFKETPRPARGTLVEYFPTFIKLMKKRYGGPIIFFLDEIDDLIEYERKSVFNLLLLFRRMATEQNCRCLVAGFRLLTAECYRHDTPLTFLQRLPLSNLTKAQSRAMLIEPMQNMGVDIQNAVFPEVLSDSGGHPQILQLYGQSFVELLDKEQTRKLTTKHVSQVKRTGVIHDRLVETLIDNTTDLEFAIVCSMANKDDFDMVAINEKLKEHGIEKSIKELQKICRSLEAIGIIRKQGQYAQVWQFAIPLQPALATLRASIVELAWEKALADEKER